MEIRYTHHNLEGESNRPPDFAPEILLLTFHKHL